MIALWEVAHPYYCSDSNYYASGTDQPFSSYASWADFDAEEGDSDLDMNLVFRWDWELPADPATYDPDLEHLTKYDDNYRAYELKIFWMGQRKGLYRGSTVSVCRADEPAVRKWLAVRWAHLRLLWEPLAEQAS